MQVEVEQDVPWLDFCQYIELAVFVDEVTSICNYAFPMYKALKSIKIPNLVKYIETGTFAGCDNWNIPHSKLSWDHGVLRIHKKQTLHFQNPKINYLIRWESILTLKKLIPKNPNFVFINFVLMGRDMTQIVYCKF